VCSSFYWQFSGYFYYTVFWVACQEKCLENSTIRTKIVILNKSRGDFVQNAKAARGTLRDFFGCPTYLGADRLVGVPPFLRLEQLA
jgi:hypothetical protein